jgi:hypothetical protein
VRTQRSAKAFALRRSDRAEDHLGPFRAEDLVEGAGELRVPVVDQEPYGRRAAVAVDGQVPRPLGDQAESGWAVEAVTKTRLIPFAWAFRELRPKGSHILIKTTLVGWWSC